ncbi:MAG: hypothetical protein N4A35_05945 [Flavobacteriales bacterium]|jgi:hypothetical protein|nr:hypothetical protein [Flavobacteriales bacterium]
MEKKRVHILILLLLLLSVSLGCVGQTVLIKDQVPEDFSTIDNGFGPNRKKYYYSYFGLGKIIATPFQDTSLSVKWNALKVASGSTYKYQLNKWFAGIFDFDFSLESYALNQINSTNTLNYKAAIEKARYVFYKVSTDLAMQFNLRPKRGNQLGNYITLGGYVDYNISRRFVTKSVYDNGYPINQKIVYKRLPFAPPFQYGVVAKYGKHYWDIFAKYRVSNAFDNGQTEIPRLIIGLEFLIHENE